MSLEERDLEQLESELDGSLPEEESTELRARLARDPLLASARDELRAERATLAAFWGALEPTDNEAIALSDRILTAAARQGDRQPAWWGRWRRVTAIAACVLISFATGWAAHSYRPATVVHTSPLPNINGAYEVALTDDHGHEVAVQKFDSADKAREFARDVRQWQERAIKVRTGTPVIVADRF